MSNNYNNILEHFSVESNINKVTWVRRLFSPTSPHKTDEVHYYLVKRQIPRKEYWRCQSQTEKRKKQQTKQRKQSTNLKKIFKHVPKIIYFFIFVAHHYDAVHPRLGCSLLPITCNNLSRCSLLNLSTAAQNQRITMWLS